MTELISKDIVDLQDIEKAQFLQTLQADPAQYATYVQGKSGRILAEAIDTKRASFAKVSGDMSRLMDMDHNSLATLERSRELSEAQGHILREQSQLEGVRKKNLDITRRQVEINNWYYENKRETLFVLQLLLLVMLTATIVMAISSYGYITKAGANYLVAFVLIVGGGTWVYRWYYTSYMRDPRYWNQRQFAQDRKTAPPDVPSLCATIDGETRLVTETSFTLPSAASLHLSS
jgi:hypothetical protein